jgi:hypothetical protein
VGKEEVMQFTKRCRMRATIVFGLAAAALLFAPSFAFSQTIPWAGSYSGHFALFFNKDPSVFPDAQVNGFSLAVGGGSEGHARVVGKSVLEAPSAFSVVSTGGCGFAGTGSTVLVNTANGAALSVSLVGAGCVMPSSISFSGTYTITGGRERLAGASGSGTFTIGEGANAGEFELAFQGTLAF